MVPLRWTINIMIKTRVFGQCMRVEGESSPSLFRSALCGKQGPHGVMAARGFAASLYQEAARGPRHL